MASVSVILSKVLWYHLILEDFNLNFLRQSLWVWTGDFYWVVRAHVFKNKAVSCLHWDRYQVTVRLVVRAAELDVQPFKVKRLWDLRGEVQLCIDQTSWPLCSYLPHRDHRLDWVDNIHKSERVLNLRFGLLELKDLIYVLYISIEKIIICDIERSLF